MSRLVGMVRAFALAAFAAAALGLWGAELGAEELRAQESGSQIARTQVSKPQVMSSQGPGTDESRSDESAAVIDQNESDPADLPRLQLEALILKALETHPSLRSLEAQRQAELAASSAANSFPDPHLSVAYADAPLSLSFTKDEMTMAEVMVSQTFPWFGKREARSKGPKLLAKAREFELERQKLVLAAEVSEAFTSLWLAGRSREILEEQKVSLEKALLLARGRYAAMGAGKTDPVRAELELMRLKERFAELDEEEAVARVLLAGLLSLPREVQGRAAALPDFVVPESLDELASGADLEERLDSHPSLAALRVQQEEREHSAELAKKESAPDITVGLMYGYRHIAGDLVSLEVRLPIPVFGKRRASFESESALAQAQGLKAAKQQGLNELRSSLRRAHATAVSRQRMLSLYRDELLPQARKTVEIASAAYQSGSGDFNAFLQAELLLLEQELAVLRTQAAFINAVAQLELALGERKFSGRE